MSEQRNPCAPAADLPSANAPPPRLWRGGLWGVAALILALFALAPQRTVPPHLWRPLPRLGGHIHLGTAHDLWLHDQMGQPTPLSTFQGRVVVLTLWASWCPPCQEELSALLKMADFLHQSAAPVELVLVSWDEDMDALQGFLATLRRPQAPNVHLLLDPGGARTRHLGTRLLPETYLIDKQGRFLAHFPGARPWDTSPYLNWLETMAHLP